LPERVGTYVARAGELAGVAHAEGLQDVVVIGMGGPNLAAETLLNTDYKFNQYGKADSSGKTRPRDDSC
jgi:hypothetical protein